MQQPQQAAGEGRSLRAVAHAVYSQPASHPVETIQKNWLASQLETKHYMMANAYGSHLPMQIRMELETVCQSRRLPGMTTSNVGAECILGRDETIDFEDYLGDPSMSEEPVDMRASLEKKYGLGPARLAGRVLGAGGAPPAVAAEFGGDSSIAARAKLGF